MQDSSISFLQGQRHREETEHPSCATSEIDLYSHKTVKNNNDAESWWKEDP